ncbi:MAG: aldehyde dehydrogenase family protein, partial [Sciscionella sp.]
MSEGPLIEVTPHECWIASRPEAGESARPVRHPYDGTEIATVWIPGTSQVERAVSAAARTTRELRYLPPELRAAAIERVAAGLTEQAEEAAELVTAESGTPLRRAAAEVTRAVAALHAAARQGPGRTVEPGTLSTGAAALVTRRPRGPVLLCTSAISPLYPIARDIAAAVAVGAPAIVLPPPHAPLCALLLGELVAGAGLPAGALSVLPLDEGATIRLVRDERLVTISFTGSSTRGRAIAAAGAGRHIVLRPEHTAAVMICADWPDLALAAQRVAGDHAARRILIDKTIFDRFLAELRDAVAALCVGEPHDPEVDSSTPVTIRVDGSGTEREGTGRTIVTSAVADLDTAIAEANRVAPDAAVGVFTHDVHSALRTAAELLARRVVIGDVPGDTAPAEDVAAMTTEYTDRHLTAFAPPTDMGKSPLFPRTAR